MTSGNVDICASVTIKSYGVVNCLSKDATVASTTLKAKVGTSTAACKTAANCAFATSTTLPSVTSVVAESDLKTLTLTGANFLTSFDATVTYGGV